MALTLIEIILFGLTVFLLHQIFHFLRERYRILQTFSSVSIPGPKPSFFTGNFPEFLAGPHEALDRWAKQYGSVYGYFQGGMPFLVLSDIDDVQEVLVKLGSAMPNRQRFIIKLEPFHSSLIQQRGAKWKRSRRILSPAFTAHKLAMNTSKTVISESIGRFLSSIERSNTQNCFNISLGMKSFSLDIITRLAFNMDPVDIYDEHCTLRKLTIEFLEHFSPFPVVLTSYFPQTESLFKILFGIFGGGQLVNTILAHLDKCIKEYTALSDTKVNILDFMLDQKAAGNLNETELLGNAILVLLAGYETSAASQIFTLYLLAKHTNIQEQLRAELRKIKSEVSQEDEDPCFFDEHRCELLDRVWFEALRLYPPVIAFITRELDDSISELTLTKSGVKITRDMIVQIPVRAIQHDPKHWNDPFSFNPFRENLPDNLSAMTPDSAFFPFGAGPRNCIGRFMALSEARAVISALLLKYRIELAQPEELDPQTGMLKVICHWLILHPANDVMLKLIPV